MFGMLKETIYPTCCDQIKKCSEIDFSMEQSVEEAAVDVMKYCVLSSVSYTNW